MEERRQAQSKCTGEQWGETGVRMGAAQPCLLCPFLSLGGC